MKKLIFFVLFFSLLSLFAIGFWVTVRTMAHVTEYIATTAEHVTPREYHYAATVDTSVIENNIPRRVVSSSEGIIYGGIVPYDQSAYPLTRTFFHAVKKQEPPIIVILTTNHTEHDPAEVVSSRYDWKTSTGILHINTDALYEVQRHVPVTVDEGVVGNEQGLQSVVTAASELLPQTTVLTFVLSPSVSTSTKVALVDALDRTLPHNAVVVASVDGHTYDTDTAAAFHGEVLRSAFARWSDRRGDEQLPQVDVLHALMVRRQATGVGCANTMHGSTGASSDELVSSYVSLCFTDGQAVSSSVSLLGFGDMMLDRNVKKQIDLHGTEYLFGSIAGKEKQFFRTVDIVSANLEGPFASYRRPTSKEIAFRFDPALIPMLTDYQFSLFTLANNHSYDMGRDGFEEAKTYLREAGIHFYGSEYAVDDNSLFIEKVGDTRIAFIGLNDTETPLTMSQILPLIERAKKEADSIVVNIHWGIEYKEVSSARQRSLAHALIDEGVDVIIGHHPHVVEEMEIYKDRPIFYSLGNFIFDQYFSVPTQQGLGVGIVFHPRELSVYLFPFQGSTSRVQLMSGSLRDVFMKSFVDRSRLGQYTIHNFHLSIPISS